MRKGFRPGYRAPNYANMMMNRGGGSTEPEQERGYAIILKDPITKRFSLAPELSTGGGEDLPEFIQKILSALQAHGPFPDRSGGSDLDEQSEIDGGSIPGAQSVLMGESNHEELSGTNVGNELNEERKKKRSKKKKKKKSHETTDLSAGENKNSGSSTLELSPEFVLVQNGGSNPISQAEMNETNGGTNPKAQSETNGGSDTREEQQKKKSHGRTDQSSGDNNIYNTELHPDFVLVQNGGGNPRAQPEMNSGSNLKEQSGTNRGSISKAQPGTNGGTNPKAQSETTGRNVTREEQNNKKSKKKGKKKSHGRTDQSSGDNITNSPSNPELNPEFVLVQNGGSNPSAKPEMNGGGNPKEQAGMSGWSISKRQPGTSGGNNPIAQLETNGGSKPKEEQKNERSKKKKKSQETPDQSVGENKNNNRSSSPAFNPDFVVVQNSIRDATVEFTHPLCNTQSERMVNMEAFNRGVVVARCDGCDDLVAVADHADLFGEDGEHEKVGVFLAFLGVDVLTGSDQSFCATFERKDLPKTNGAK